ncbi:hypothetical protein [Paraburkholderia aromaticivorans]|uniref:hypothetical protein n=1 Tax=Paraburkholderia aromaticivorans TaxID=2026199 RepID=UPI0012FD3A54|nr:hypothetical protein [Paraburkholderia aromaticivorans]
MKKIELPQTVSVAALVIVDAISVTGGAYVGFGKGYERGSFDGHQEATRNTPRGYRR